MSVFFRKLSMKKVLNEVPEAIREPTIPTDPHWKGFPEKKHTVQRP